MEYSRLFNGIFKVYWRQTRGKYRVFSRYTKEPKRNRSFKGYMKDFDFFSLSVNEKFETFDGKGLSGSMEDSFFSQ